MSKAEEDFVAGSDKMLSGLQGMHPTWERAEFVKLPDGHARFFVTPPYHPDVDPNGSKAIPRAIESKFKAALEEILELSAMEMRDGDGAREIAEKALGDNYLQLK